VTIRSEEKTTNVKSELFSYNKMQIRKTRDDEKWVSFNKMTLWLLIFKKISSKKKRRSIHVRCCTVSMCLIFMFTGWYDNHLTITDHSCRSLPGGKKCQWLIAWTIFKAAVHWVATVRWQCWLNHQRSYTTSSKDLTLRPL